MYDIFSQHSFLRIDRSTLTQNLIYVHIFKVNSVHIIAIIINVIFIDMSKYSFNDNENQ